MEEKQIVLGAALFIMLSTIPENYQGGKRGRKAIMKELKKKLKIYGSTSPVKYSKLANMANDVIQNARENLEFRNMDKEDLYYTNPGMMLKFIKWRYPEFVSMFELKNDHIENINSHYLGTGLGFQTIMFSNKLINELSNISV